MIDSLFKRKQGELLSFILLGAAILVAGIVRFWKLTTLPLPPNGDELAFAYYGWSLVHFLTDEYGNLLPIYFPSIGDFKYPTLAYLNTIPAALFGLSDITARFWSALMGTGLVLLVFILSRMIFKSTLAALASAWFIALSPWAITLSRLGYEANIAVFLTTMGIIFLLLAAQTRIKKFLRRKTLIYLAFAALFLSAFAYGAQRVFIPSFLLSLVALSFIKGSELKVIRKQLIALFVILTLVIAISLIPWQSRGRASGVFSVGISAEDQQDLDESIRGAGLSSVKPPIVITRAFNNKVNTAVLNLVDRYGKHFSPEYLFLKGDASLETTPRLGVLLLIESVFFFVGLLLLFADSRRRALKFVVLAWLLVGPIASALTVGGPHIVRGAIGLPPFALISGYGASRVINFSRVPYKRLVILLVAAAVLGNALFALNQIFVQKPTHRPWDSDQATKEMTQTVLSLKDKYDAIAIPDDQYIFFLYYGKTAPKEFLAAAEIAAVTQDNHWEPVERLGNIFFKMPYACPKGGKLNVLYVCKGLNIPQNAKVVKVIRFQDDVPAFTLIEFFPLSQLPATLPELPTRLEYMVDREYLYPDGIIPSEQPLPW